MKRGLLFVFATLTMPFLMGCKVEFGLERFADALDNLTDKIDKTTADGGNLDRRIKQLANEIRDLLKDAKQKGIELTDYMVWNFVKQRQQTIEEIYQLTQKVFGDTRVLIQELQGAGLSFPLNLSTSLQAFGNESFKELSALLASINFVGISQQGKPVPINYRGLTWSLRPEGFHEVWFAINQAQSLKLKIGKSLIAPAKPPTTGSVTYTITITPQDYHLFDDTEYRVLGFQLVEDQGKNGQGLPQVRYDGWIRLTPRFPIKYEFQVFPPGNNLGESHEIVRGSAILNLIRAVPYTDPLDVARRHGQIYRLAKSRLAVGTSFVTIPKGTDYWQLTITFPDGKTCVLDPNTRISEPNEFGQVTVTGPNPQGDEWILLVNATPKKE
ncbi:MAG: hypothetical protein RMJ88_07390 [Thermogemmata sp.]|nr:hypothetical protein [Thermogemmata sp.]